MPRNTVSDPHPTTTPAVPSRAERVVRRTAVALALCAFVAPVSASAGVRLSDRTGPPLNVSAPQIVGAAHLDWPLSARPGDWVGAPADETYQWQSCTADLTRCDDVAGATGETYTPVTHDLGRRDRLEVGATSPFGGAVAYSAPTDVVTIGPPLARARPTVLGVARAGSTLRSTDGAWSGDPSAYSYEWRRCDANGNGCSAIDGATRGSYALTRHDVGATIRVALAASNTGGSTTAVSDPTAVVATASGSSAPDFAADPSLTGTLAPWDKFDAGADATLDGVWVSSQPGGATFPGTVGVVDDPVGREGKVYRETVTAAAHASTASSSDATYLFNYPKPYLGNNGQDTWIHFRMLLPAGYRPTPGEWNIFNEFHDDSAYMRFYDAKVIGWEYPELALYVTNYHGRVPHLMYRIRGGVDGAHNFAGTDVSVADPLRLDHWYDILLHVVWSPDPKTGRFEWWLDGRRIASIHRPTLWQRPDGGTDHVELELNNYRAAASWDATVYYGRIAVGSSRAAVGF
jgi:hypothetical protein